MNDDRISVIDAARELGLTKQAVFKMLNRLGIESFKERNDRHAGQAIAYIRIDDFDFLQREVESRQVTTPDESTVDSLECGVFYVIQLEPEHDAGRFKVGFAVNIAERLRAHRCSAPFAIVVKTWPCKRLWERTAIDCVTDGCERLHTEVFRTDNLESVVTKCEAFFSMMPNVVA